MELEEYRKEYGVYANYKIGGTVAIAANLKKEATQALYSLTDYKVSSCVAGTYWLVPNR